MLSKILPSQSSTDMLFRRYQCLARAIRTEIRQVGSETCLQWIKKEDEKIRPFLVFVTWIETLKILGKSSLTERSKEIDDFCKRFAKQTVHHKAPWMRLQPLSFAEELEKIDPEISQGFLKHVYG